MATIDAADVLQDTATSKVAYPSQELAILPVEIASIIHCTSSVRFILLTKVHRRRLLRDPHSRPSLAHRIPLLGEKARERPK